jgi:signal peptidase I
MTPTLSEGDTVSVNLDAYATASPQVGDIITFNPPLGAERGNECGAPRPPGSVCPTPTPEQSEFLFIKRIAALPGDEVSIAEGAPVVNGERAAEDFIQPCRGFGGCDFPKAVTIPPDHYFVLGDNRAASDDSRFWGPVPAEWIQGKVEP